MTRTTLFVSLVVTGGAVALLSAGSVRRQQAVEVKHVALALRERRALVQKGVAQQVEPGEVDLDCIL